MTANTMTENTMTENTMIADHERNTMTIGNDVSQTVAAKLVAPLVEALAPNLAVRVELWDGTAVGRPGGPPVRMRSVDALRRLLWAPGELGFGRAYVAGDIDMDMEGDIFDTIAALRPAGSQLRIGPRQLAALIAAARGVGALGRPLPPPSEEARPQGVRHSIARDARVVSHHYDVGNDFYRLVLGPSMTYSCARFADPTITLEDAQASKHDLPQPTSRSRAPGRSSRPSLRHTLGVDGDPRRQPLRRLRGRHYHQP